VPDDLRELRQGNRREQGAPLRDVVKNSIGIVTALDAHVEDSCATGLMQEGRSGEGRAGGPC
jgi:hypothetical protein